MDPTTSKQLADIEKQCPDWHTYCTGTICWAVTSHTPWPGRGITVDAPTPSLLRDAITAEEHRWEAEAA